MRSLLFTAAHLLCAAALLGAASAQEQPVDTAAALRQQHAAQFPRAGQVQVRGVVTFLFPTPGVAYLQDATGGIAVVGTRDRQVRGD